MNTIFNFVGLLASTSSSSGSEAGANNTTSIWFYVILIGLVVMMLVLPMITQRKRNKEYAEMLGSLEVGDTIKTIGGIIGRVLKIKEKDGAKSFILETGDKGNKMTMEFDIASVAYIMNTKVKPQEAKVEEKKEEVEATPVEAETAPAAPVEEKKEEKKPAAKKSSSKTATKRSTKK